MENAKTLCVFYEKVGILLTTKTIIDLCNMFYSCYDEEMYEFQN